ncbi:SDR family oxidoreductase [Mesorhizobium sp. IMUNJ 23232]|uniref:SDR family oxidoreductase n=1 Tax=Mesorhizobium sp. IMUNJ 23232 TaxID=3376064 RepID=UPI003788820B
MRVFVTGSTGFIGSAIVQDLIAAGHKVLGLARSDAGAASLAAIGADVHRGSLEDFESLSNGAATSDGVIHTAFNHNFSTYLANCEADRQVIEALGAGLAGSGRPLVVTSGTGRQKETQRAPDFTAHPRLATEAAAASVAAQGVPVSVVRLPPSVHGEGDHGFVPMIIRSAREKGVSAYVGDGLNQWPAVHRLDAARLFRLALEKGAPEAWYHGVGDEGVAFRNIAELIGRHLDITIVGMTPEEAAGHFGFLAQFAAANLPASGAQTQQLLGWHPTQPGLIPDLDQGHYFEAS